MKALFPLIAAMTLAISTAEEPFSLRIGETAEVEGIDLSLTFVDVPLDSRCPRDVQCIVAGEAHVVLELTHGSDTGDLTFRLPPGGSDEHDVDGFTIAIVKLEPETNSTKKLDASDYVATVLVTVR